jgi:hypothetical protein
MKPYFPAPFSELGKLRHLRAVAGHAQAFRQFTAEWPGMPAVQLPARSKSGLRVRRPRNLGLAKRSESIPPMTLAPVSMLCPRIISETLMLGDDFKSVTTASFICSSFNRVCFYYFFLLTSVYFLPFVIGFELSLAEKKIAPFTQ